MTSATIPNTLEQFERDLDQLCKPTHSEEEDLDRLGELLQDPTSAEAAREIEEILGDRKPTAVSIATGARRRASQSDAHLFERRLLGRYIEHFERFANTITLALERTANLTQGAMRLVEAAEAIARTGQRECAVVQCFQNVSWEHGVKRAGLTTGEALLIGPETIDLRFEIEVEGPVEFEVKNQGESFLVMTSIRLGDLVRARGSLVRYCEELVFKGQVFIITCAKPKFSTTVQERKP